MGDVRYSLRLLVRGPGFALVSVLTLALGVGANTAIFSVVRSVLMAPLPFTDPDRLVVVWHSYPPALPRAAVSVPGYDDLRAASDLFVDAAAFVVTNQNLTGAGEPERLLVARATSTFQPVLGLPIARGRWFTAEEDAPGDSSVVVLSDGLWRRRFGADPRLVGQTIRLNDRPHQVIGIAAPSATFPKTTDAWVPAAFTAEQHRPVEHGNEFLTVVARLAPGIDLARARARLGDLAARLKRESYPSALRWTLDMRPIADDLVRDARPVLFAVFGAVGLVLLVACVNVAGLLLARAGHRRRELAVRAAVGAAPARLRRQLLAESATLGALGGVAGLLVAVALVPLLARAVAAALPRAEAPHIDLTVLAFALGLALGSSLLFGLIPFWQLARVDLRAALSDQARGGTGRRAGRLLVAAELALAFSVLVCAALLVRSFARVVSVDPGFSPEGRLTVHVSLPPARYATSAERAAFYGRLFDRLSALPGVRDAGGVSELPFGEMRNMGTFEIEGRSTPPGGDLPHADWRSASPRYFSAIGLGLVAGRLFDARDGGDAPMVAMVDDLAAAKYWPGRSPIGDRLTINGVSSNMWREIVGVVRTVHHDALDVEPRGTVYVPLPQRATGSLYLVVRAGADPLSLVTAVRAAVRAIDPELPIYDVRTLDDRLADTLGRRRMATWLIGVFAALAAALAAIGVYGVTSYDVGERAKEIAIRMALGARRETVIGLVLGEGLWMAGVGVAAGAALAFIGSRITRSLLFGVSASDPATYAVPAAAVIGLTVAAAYLPARRAASVNPVDTLR
jgi:predicted permease